MRVPDVLQDVSFIEKNSKKFPTRRDGHTPRLTTIPRRTRTSPIRPASSVAALLAIREWRPRITFSRRTARGEWSERRSVPAREGGGGGGGGGGGAYLCQMRKQETPPLRVERCSPRKQILSILCPTQFLSTLRMARRYHWTEPKRLFRRRWQRRRSGIGR